MVYPGLPTDAHAAPNVIAMITPESATGPCCSDQLIWNTVERYFTIPVNAIWFWGTRVKKVTDNETVYWIGGKAFSVRLEVEWIVPNCILNRVLDLLFIPFVKFGRSPLRLSSGTWITPIAIFLTSLSTPHRFAVCETIPILPRLWYLTSD